MLASERPQFAARTTITPPGKWLELDLRELAHYRDLFFFLCWRDVSVRYKQTVLGPAWAILQPFLTMVVFTIFFGKLAKMPSDGIPYPIFSFAGLLPWLYFESSVGKSSASLVGNVNLLTKVYFPRLIIPLAGVIPGLVDFALAFVVLLGLMAFYRVPPGWHILWLPVLMLMAVLAALGTGLWLSALNVKYRDIGFIVPFLTRFWMFISPVIYPASTVKGKWWLLYALNPMTGVIEGFRWALLGTATNPAPYIAISAGMTLLLLVGGLVYFQKTEKHFADLV